MKQQEYIIHVRERCETKTSQMLDVLGIEHLLPFKSVEIDGIYHLVLSQNGIIYARFNIEIIEKILALPYVIDIALANKD